jgi:NAD(P)-dependent dehydrogenase (short-subunit alcohol dehydrogenase family)
MNTLNFTNLRNKVCIITGGAGILGSSIVEALSLSGIKTVIADINVGAAQEIASRIEKRSQTKCMAIKTDVLSKDSLLQLKKEVNDQLGPIDFLINGAGGNSPAATTEIEQLSGGINDLEKSFYGLDTRGFEKVFALNFIGTLLPTMVLTKDMVTNKKGAVINISSMSALKPLTKVVAYSAAKASVNNFTEWLAVHLGKTGIRINAIAPGFFITEQNRFLVLDEQTGEFTERGKKIVDHTPMGKFGNPEDLHGVILFLLSDLSHFITGTVIPVDGGFNAFGGV